MNHYADVEEGLDTFDDERERSEAERLFQENPHLVTFTHEASSFVAYRVHVVHLLGNSRPTLKPRKFGSPALILFDFSDGYLVADGRVDELHGSSRIVSTELRWSDFGKNLQVTHE